MTLPAPFRCLMGGEETTLSLDADGLDVAGRRIAWGDVDDIVYPSHGVELVIGSGLAPEPVERLVATHLGGRADECHAAIRELRGSARRSLLLQTAAAPAAVFESRGADGVADVVLLPHAVSIEPRTGGAAYVPFALVETVERQGYAFELRTRGIPAATVSGLGRRSDEFELTVRRLMAAQSATLSAAYATLGLADVTAAAGQPLPPSHPDHDRVLETWSSLGRTAEATALRTVADEVRPGLWLAPGEPTLPFLLARRGEGADARVAVEQVDGGDRATFVFATDDLDALGAALVLTSFRREALSADAPDLGRWAAAVRTQPVVRWARDRLVDRLVHGAGWEQRMRAAMGVA